MRLTRFSSKIQSCRSQNGKSWSGAIGLEHEEITHPKRKRFLTNALQIFPDSPIFVFSLHQ